MLTEEQKEALLKQHEERGRMRELYHAANLAAAAKLSQRLKKDT
jgi:hypothetical protein